MVSQRFVRRLLFATLTVFCACFLLQCSRSEKAASATKTNMREQSVTFYMDTYSGVARLIAFSTGIPYTIDKSKLHFYIRPHEMPSVQFRPIPIAIGAPGPSPSNKTRLAMDVDLEHLRVAPGLYDLTLAVVDGFAVDDTGKTLEVANAKFQEVVWFADLSNGDRGLQSARQRFNGRDIHGYGGIRLGCEPMWSTLYPPSTPVRVKSVQRDAGRVEELWTGGLVRWYNDAVPSFFAVNPLRFIVAKPRDKWTAADWSGGAHVLQTASMNCPSIELADWQVDSTVTTEKPTIVKSGSATFPVRVGMTRDEVAWLEGYPTVYYDRETMRKEAAWQYVAPAPFSFSVTFSNDRVSSFTTPGELP